MFKSICTISFALALFFTQVAHALPQPDMVPRDPTNPPSTPRAAFDSTFDNPAYSVNGVACSNLASKYPTFSTVPNYPYIGGAWDVAWNNPGCGGCWKITNPKNNQYIYMTAVDTAGHGFNLGTQAFSVLNGGVHTTIDVVATKADAWHCGM